MSARHPIRLAKADNSTVPDHRPWVCLNVAMTADGKIAPARGRYQPFGSQADMEHLLRLRAVADAIMAGAGTVGAYPVTLGSGGERYRRMRQRRGLAPCPLRVIVSGRASLSPNAELFRHRFSPVLVVTSARASARRVEALRRVATEVRAFGQETVDLKRVLRWLRRKWHVRRLVCEGGGTLNAAMIRAGLVDEIYLTICPLILGGHTAPTLAEGSDPLALSEARRFELCSVRRVGDELFLRYVAAK